MTKTSKTIRRMPNVRKIIQDRLKALDMSHYALAEKIGDKVTKSTVYAFLAGESEINSESLGHILDALKLKITPDERR